MIMLSTARHAQSEGEKIGDKTEFEIAISWINTIHYMLGSDVIRIVPPMLKEYKVNFINAEQNRANFAIELRFNTTKNKHDPTLKTDRGSETWFNPKSYISKEAATIIQTKIALLFKPDRGIKEGYYKTNKNKGMDYFLRKVHLPSIILLPEFISNIDLINDNKNDACLAICEAIKIIKKRLVL